MQKCSKRQIIRNVLAPESPTNSWKFFVLISISIIPLAKKVSWKCRRRPIYQWRYVSLTMPNNYTSLLFCFLLFCCWCFFLFFVLRLLQLWKKSNFYLNCNAHCNYCVASPSNETQNWFYMVRARAREPPHLTQLRNAHVDKQNNCKWELHKYTQMEKMNGNNKIRIIIINRPLKINCLWSGFIELMVSTVIAVHLLPFCLVLFCCCILIFAALFLPIVREKFFFFFNCILKLFSFCCCSIIEFKIRFLCRL